MKKIILSLIISFTAGYIVAQEVITTAGDEFIQSGFSLNFTIGEPVAETFQVGDVILTQGFQQPWNFGFDQWINVAEGWSGISGYIEPYNNDLDFLFEDHQNNLVILSNFNGMYFPSQGINTLFFWNNTSGYQVKASEEFDLRLKGWQLDNNSLELEAGWHILPVLSACNVAVDGGLGNTSIQIVKEIAGTKIFWPEYGINTIGDLLPGRAYYMLLNSLSNIQFSECGTKSTGKTNTVPKTVNLTCWDDPPATAQSHVVLVPREFLSEFELTTGDYLGGFTSTGICAGLIQIGSYDKNHCLTLFGDDPLTPLQDGFMEGEPITIRLFRAATGKETSLNIIFDPEFPDQGYFTGHGISKIKTGSTEIGSPGFADKNGFTIFPNPAKETVTIAWMQENAESITICFYNSFGQIVMSKSYGIEKSGKQQHIIDFSNFGKGAYFCRMQIGSNIITRKIVKM